MSVSFKEALKLGLNGCKTVTASEIIDISNSLSRVLAKDVICVKNLPSFNNSAMDGYALKYSEIGSRLKVAAKIFAGDKQETILKENECYKIMTGAKVPNDADTIAPYEICEIDGDYIKVAKEIKKGNALRLKGEEQKKGSLLFEKGTVLTFDKIALLASQGIMQIEVFKPLKIAVLSTGNELKEPWQEASEDEVYNINGINIQMFLKKNGFESGYLGSLPDDLDAATEAINGLKNYDLIITTGGISGGDADFTKQAFLQNGLKELFHGVKVKPGHPTMMGVMGNSFVMAMPGNPLAAIVNIMLLSIPIIYKMQGAKDYLHKPIPVKNGLELKLKPGRTNIVLGNLINGKFKAYKNNKYGSGMITPLVESEYVAIFDEDKSLIKEGEEIEVVRI